MFYILRKKKYVLLMFQNITQIVKSKLSFNDFKWRKVARPCSKKLSPLLREITSKHCTDFYCLNCLNSFRTKNKLESHIRLCENKDFCNIVMSSEDAKILEFNKYQKSDKAPLTFYVDLECIKEKIDECKNNSED